MLRRNARFEAFEGAAQSLNGILRLLRIGRKDAYNGVRRRIVGEGVKGIPTDDGEAQHGLIAYRVRLGGLVLAFVLVVRAVHANATIRRTNNTTPMNTPLRTFRKLTMCVNSFYVERRNTTPSVSGSQAAYTSSSSSSYATHTNAIT
jgi:hypothetical protein